MSEIPPPPGAGAGPPPPPPPGSAAGRPARRPTGRGAAGTGVIPRHPLSLGDILDGAFQLLRGTFSQIAVLVLVVLGPIQLLQALATLGQPNLLTVPEGTGPPEIQTAAVVALGVGVLLTFLVTPLVNGAVTAILARHDRGEDLSWGEGLRAAWSRYGTLLGSMILTTLLIGLVAVLLLAALALPLAAIGALAVPLAVVLGIPAFIGYMLVMVGVGTLAYLIIPTIMLEDVGAVTAIRRAAGLLRRRFWAVVGIAIVAGLIIGLLAGALLFVFNLMTLFGGPVGATSAALGGLLNSLVALPVSAAIALLVYLDLRIRFEGLDVELLTADLPR